MRLCLICEMTFFKILVYGGHYFFLKFRFEANWLEIWFKVCITLLQ